MTSPYRKSEEIAAPPRKSGEMVYRPRERSDRVAAGRGAIHLFALPAIAGGIVGAMVRVEAGAGVFLALVAANYYRSHKQPADAVVLRVADGELCVLPMGSKKESFRTKLADLDNVAMETKAVERVLDVGANAVNIGMGQLAPNVAPSGDTRRIVLEARSGTHILTKEFFGDAETLEHFAQIRRFLRGVGWTPLPEREEEEEEEDDDDE